MTSSAGRLLYVIVQLHLFVCSALRRMSECPRNSWKRFELGLCVKREVGVQVCRCRYDDTAGGSLSVTGVCFLLH